MSTFDTHASSANRGCPRIFERADAPARAQQHIPAPPEEVFPFFADARNLEAITPPWLGFRVITPRPIEMGAGRADRVPAGAPRRARPLAHAHRGVGARRQFVDAQIRGPYRLWHHTHTFEPAPGGHAGARQGPLRAAPRPARRAAHRLFVRATSSGSSTTATARSLGASQSKVRRPMRTFWRLLGFLRPYRSGVIVSFVLAAVAMGAGVLIPYLVGRTVDEIRDGGDEPLAARRSPSSAPGCCGSSSASRAGWSPGGSRSGVEFDLRNRMYAHLSRSSSRSSTGSRPAS